MNFRIIALILTLIPGIGAAASRADGTARVAAMRADAVASRMPVMSKLVIEDTEDVEVPDEEDDENDAPESDSDDKEEAKPAGDCREAYRACMDEFCLLDESEGYRCACSGAIENSKSLILDIQQIQEDADKLYTEGVEREKLGAKADMVFGKKITNWLEGVLGQQTEDDSENELGADDLIGDALYETAQEYCKAELDACGTKAKMEEMLYSRQITADCKAYASYLADQKTNAQANKRTAEAAVRQARLEMFDTTNKYNRGECLLAYRACIADKGGCGTKFENCLDKGLLTRRAEACANVLDQCMGSRTDVLKDWAAESESILEDAKKYADKYQRQTCLAKIQVCLEDGCSTATNSACLSDVEVAAGVCPIIGECEEMIPGIKAVINDKLGYLRTQFCQNDVDACLRDKCGQNFTAPECVGKKPAEIIAMCPQSMFPACKNETETQFGVIVSAAVLQMDYQMMQGCVNHFGEQLGKVCGTDMACLPSDDTVMALMEIPEKEEDFAALRVKVRDNAKAAVDEFFKQFEQDKTVAQCLDAEKPAGVSKLGNSVFTTAKLIAEIGAENRAMRELETKIAELSRKQDLEDAEKNCYATYKVETPDKSSKNYSYIRSVAFEPSLRNCHVCRMQQVCETGGESKASAGLKAAAGGLTAGASAGTMINAGWGTAIGAVVGAVGAGIGGALAGGKQDFCQEIESCEDVNM